MVLPCLQCILRLDIFIEKQRELGVELDSWSMFIQYYTTYTGFDYNPETTEYYGNEHSKEWSVYICGLNENTPEICYIYGPIPIWRECTKSNCAFTCRM